MNSMFINHTTEQNKINIGNIAMNTFSDIVDDIIDEQVTSIEKHFKNVDTYHTSFAFHILAPSFLKIAAEKKIRDILNNIFIGINIATYFVDKKLDKIVQHDKSTCFCKLVKNNKSCNHREMIYSNAGSNKTFIRVVISVDDIKK